MPYLRRTRNQHFSDPGRNGSWHKSLSALGAIRPRRGTSTTEARTRGLGSYDPDSSETPRRLYSAPMAAPRRVAVGSVSHLTTC